MVESPWNRLLPVLRTFDPVVFCGDSIFALVSFSCWTCPSSKIKIIKSLQALIPSDQVCKNFESLLPQRLCHAPPGAQQLYWELCFMRTHWEHSALVVFVVPTGDDKDEMWNLSCVSWCIALYDNICTHVRTHACRTLRLRTRCNHRLCFAWNHIFYAKHRRGSSSWVCLAS